MIVLLSYNLILVQLKVICMQTDYYKFIGI